LTSTAAQQCHSRLQLLHLTRHTSCTSATLLLQLLRCYSQLA
jgi:hypothetical protein